MDMLYAFRQTMDAEQINTQKHLLLKCVLCSKKHYELLNVNGLLLFFFGIL